MAIDLNETIITLSHAARLCPARRGGKPTHVSCIYRWTTRGLKGVVLEVIQVGGTRCTSREALDRFFNRLTFGGAQHCRYRTPAQRQRAAERAARELEREGA